MKRIVAIAVVLALISNCTYSLRHYRVYARGNIIELNNTIGDVIDTEERAEYDLFPDMGGFKEARFYTIPDGGYEVEIITDRRKYVAVNRDALANQILKDYFSRYNTPQYNQGDFEKKWKIVAYDILGFPITQREVDKNIKHGCCIGATAGCGLASLGMSGLVALVTAVSGPWGQEEVNEPLFFTILIGGTLAGVVTGSLSGGKMDRDRAIDAIGEARMPRVVE
jgi:hypothetical protein